MDLIKEFLIKHTGEIIGGLIGLVFAIFVLIFGFFKTLFIFICIGVGIFIGGRYFEKKKLIELLDKHLPW